MAAWRHIVNVVRAAGARNASWLWTINVFHKRTGIAPPGPWWPGSSYVTWVGIDGYYHKPSWSFAPLFGPTIKAVRALTIDPILISETGAAPAANKPAKVTNLFAGVRDYGLLGFVWFDADHTGTGGSTARRRSLPTGGEPGPITGPHRDRGYPRADEFPQTACPLARRTLPFRMRCRHLWQQARYVEPSHAERPRTGKARHQLIARGGQFPQTTA